MPRAVKLQSAMKTSGLILCLFCLPMHLSIYGEAGRVVIGQVVNSTNGDPVPGAYIRVVGTTRDATSGPDGTFQLRLPAGQHRLEITALGFAASAVDLRVPLEDNEAVRIELEPELIELEPIDVLVLGQYSILDRHRSINSEPISVTPAVSRVSPVDVERQGAVTVVDALKYIPGGWTETRGRKTKQFFSVRGQKYPYPEYSIDGVWQKDFEETAYVLSALDIESIEIVRSSGALVKGLSGLSGLIDIRTRKPDRESTSFLLKYGELNSFFMNAQYGNRVNSVAYNLSAAVFGTDGLPDSNSRERIANLYGTVDWEINSGLDFSASNILVYGSREFTRIVEPGSPNLLNVEEKFDPFLTLLTAAKLDYKGSDGSITELQANLAYRNPRYSSFHLVEQTTTAHRETDYEIGFNLLHSRQLGAARRLRVGALYNNWVAPEGKRYYHGSRCNVHTWSGVAAAEQRAGRFVFDAGLRLVGGYIAEWGGFGIEGSAAGFQDVAPIRDQFAPLGWQSVFGTSFLVSSSSSLHYSFAGGRVAPRRGALTEEGGTPESESRWKHDFGLIIQPGAGKEFSVSVFYVDRGDAIELSGATAVGSGGSLVELYENLDKRNYGVEFVSRVAIPRFHTSVFVNATAMRGVDRTDGDKVRDEKMPRLVLNGGVLFERSGVDVNLFANYIGPYENDRFLDRRWVLRHGPMPLGDFLSVDVSAGYTFGGDVSKRIFVEVRNVFDRAYQTVPGYPDPGRVLMTGLRVRVG